MKIIIGQIMHESNSFSPLITKLEDFKNNHLLFGNEVLNYHQGKKTEIGGMLEIINNQKFEIIPTISASTLPGGPLSDEAFEFLLNKLLSYIKGIQKIDGIMLVFHGAMQTKKINDAEGYMLTKIRDLIGNIVPIGVTLDHHANVTKKMVDKSNAIISYRTHPHIDQYDIGKKLAIIMIDILKKKIYPVMKMIRIPMIIPGESSPKVRHCLVKKIKKLEESRKIISASFNIGYPFANSKSTGPSVLVITNDDESLARKKCTDFAKLMWSLRDNFLFKLPNLEETVRYIKHKKEKLYVLCDLGDCVFAGGVGDVNIILEAFLKEKINGAVLHLVDSEAVEKCIEAGVGTLVNIKVGGKIDKINGKNLTISGKIIKIRRSNYKGYGIDMIKKIIDRGKTAVLKVKGIDIVITEKRSAVHDPNFFRSLGIEPTTKNIIVIKDAYCTTLTYKEIAEEVIFVDSPGICRFEYNELHFKGIRRPIYPFDNFSFDQKNILNS